MHVSQRNTAKEISPGLPFSVFLMTASLEHLEKRKNPTTIGNFNNVKLNIQ
jgi:hypothetical protein